MAMTKTEMISTIAKRANENEDIKVTQAEVKSIFNAIASVVAEEVKASGECKFNGLGKFVGRKRAARTMTSYLHGEEKVFELPERTVVAFKPSANLNDFVNNDETEFVH